MSGINDEFSGSLTPDVLAFNFDVSPISDALCIRMTRDERRIADELRKQFGGFRRVIIDVDGEQHEFNADSLIRLLEGYESYGQVPEQGERENDAAYESYGSHWHELFGTPERAARTLLRVDSSCCNSEVNGIKQSCVTCPLNMNGLEYPKMRCYAYVNEDSDELLEWLREDCVHHG